MRKRMILLLALLLVLAGCQSRNDAQVKTDEGVKKEQVFIETKVDNYDVDLEVLRELFNEDNIIVNITELTSEKYLGRYTGEQGNDLAAEYLASKMKEYGFSTFNGDTDYLDPFEMYVYQTDTAPQLRILDENNEVTKTFKFVDEFTYFTRSCPTVDVAQVPILLGNEDLTDEEIKDQIILVPWEQYKKMQDERYMTAKAIVFNYKLDDPYSGKHHFSRIINCGQYPESEEVMPERAVLYVDDHSFKAIVDNTKLGNKLAIKADHKKVLVETNNVIGLIPGKDVDGVDDYIFLTGHYDHIGSNFDGTYNPGALDNASGTSMILELGRVLKEANLHLDPTIVIVGFSGEEEYLVGSKYFADEYGSEFENAVVFNFDMVGSVGDMTYELSMVSELYPTSFIADIKECSKKANFRLASGTGSSSDHKSFADIGIPAVTFIEFNNEHYHYRTDTVDKINKSEFPLLANVLFEYIKLVDERGE